MADTIAFCKDGCGWEERFTDYRRGKQEAISHMHSASVIQVEEA